MTKDLDDCFYEHGQLVALFAVIKQYVEHCSECKEDIGHLIPLTRIVDERMRKLRNDMDKLILMLSPKKKLWKP